MSEKVIVGVFGLPVNKQGELYLTQRHAPGKKNWHHKWQLAGGALDFGETPEDTLKRELWEEIRVKPTILYPHPIVKTNVWYADEHDSKKDAQIILITYIVDIGSQEPDLTHDPDWETADGGWFSYDQALQLDFLPNGKEIIKDAFEVIKKNAILR